MLLSLNEKEIAVLLNVLFQCVVHGTGPFNKYLIVFHIQWREHLPPVLHIISINSKL